MNTTQLCRLLLCGQLKAAAVPELSDPEVRAEVEERFAKVGASLRYAQADQCWLVVLDAPLPEEAGLAPIQPLNETDRAVAAAAWLHLVFLPAERRAAAEVEGLPLPAEPGERPTISEDDLYAQFQERMKRTYFGIVVGKLKKLGFLRQRGGGSRLEAGPILAVIGDETAAAEARRVVATHKRLLLLRRRAADLTADLGLDQPAAANQADPDNGGGVPPRRRPLGQRVRAARMLLGLSQEALAREVGVDQGRVSRIERGDEQPPRGVLEALADALALHVQELLDDEEEHAAG